MWGAPFYELDLERQVQLIAFDDVRSAEEAERTAAMMKATPVFRL